MDWIKLQIDLQAVFDMVESGKVKELKGADMNGFLTVTDLCEAIYDATSYGMVSGESDDNE